MERVQLPYGPPNKNNGAIVQTARTVGLHPADESSILSGSTLTPKIMGKVDKKNQEVTRKDRFPSK